MDYFILPAETTHRILYVAYSRSTNLCDILKQNTSGVWGLDWMNWVKSTIAIHYTYWLLSERVCAYLTTRSQYIYTYVADQGADVDGPVPLPCLDRPEFRSPYRWLWKEANLKYMLLPTCREIDVYHSCHPNANQDSMARPISWIRKRWVLYGSSCHNPILWAKNFHITEMEVEFMSHLP